MGEKQKILFCGDVEGQFNKLFERVESINKKSGPFDCLICVGNFFGVNNKEFEPYQRKERTVTIPTFILGPNKEEHVDLYPKGESELCPNIFYIGKRGLYINSGNLKIAYISGVATKESVQNAYSYNIDDAVALKDTCRKGNANFKGVDILITSQWPEDITKFDTDCKLGTAINMHSPIVSWLNAQLMPRYHICGLEGIYYERPPFRSVGVSEHDPLSDHATRFLGLARVGNPKKEKWLYALSLSALDKTDYKMLAQRTTDETPCPFNLSDLEKILFKSKRPTTEHNQYFFDMNKYEEPNKHHKNKRQKVEFDQTKCWFCLASPSVEKHLVITVGSGVYLALAKGSLVDEHFLICPIEHHRSANEIPDAVLNELQQFKESVRKFYASKKKVPVFFERNYKTSHMQMQVIPIPPNAAKELKEIFQEEAEGHGFKLEDLEDHQRLNQVIPKGAPYFYVELPTGEALYTKIAASTYFPINFGREILASGPILNLPDRIDWRECSMGKESEETLVKRLRNDFQPFDFT